MNIAFRKIFVCFIAVFAISAVAATAASAHGWKVKGCVFVGEPNGSFEDSACTKAKPKGAWEKFAVAHELTAGQSAEVSSSGGTFTLTAGGKTVTCKKVTDTGTVEAGGKDKAAEIQFTECTTGTAGCEVKGKKVVVTAIPTLLEEPTGKLIDKFEQKLVGTTKEFVTLEFEGEACAAAGYVTTKVKGDVAAEVKNEANGEVKLTFPATPIAQTPKLEAFGVAATLVGTVSEKLVHGETLTAE
jgi:hypothetical protein